MANPDHALYPSQQARDRFGLTLTRWSDQAGWSHDIPLRWGKAAKFPTVADSTFNRMQRGKIAQPYPVTFIQFGMMNDRLARKDYGLQPEDPLLPRIARQRPIEHEDGRPWSAADFFAHFIGDLEPPAWAQEQPLPSLEESVAASTEVTELFRETAQGLGLSLPAAWESLAQLAVDPSGPVPPLGEADLETLRQVLSGWHAWTPEQLRDLRDLEGGLQPLTLLRYWKDSLRPSA